MPIFGCCFSLQLTFFPESSLRERCTAKMIYSMRSVFWILIGSWAAGLVGVEWCPAPSGIRKSGTSQMAIPVTAISWQQANLDEKTENMLLRALLAPNNEEFSCWIRVSVCPLQQVPEFLHGLVSPELDLFHLCLGAVRPEKSPEEICLTVGVEYTVKS